jgi:hypothetical protein
MSYQIENIAPPAPPAPPVTSSVGSIYPFAQLQETQSFVVGADQKDHFAKIRSAASYYSQKNKVWLRCYTRPDGTLQVYRDLDNSGKRGGGRKPSETVIPPPAAPQPPQIVVVTPAPPAPTPPAAPPAPVLVGPTHEQWCEMLAKMPVTGENDIWRNLNSRVITNEYKQFFPQMQAWTMHYGAATRRHYSALVVGGALTIIRGEDVEDVPFTFDADIPTDAIESEADNAEVPVVASAGQTNLDTLQEPVAAVAPEAPLQPLSAANDGWTGRPCVKCHGLCDVQGQYGMEPCVWCNGTGEEYIAALDKRQQLPPATVPAVSPLEKPADSATLGNIAEFINKSAQRTVLLDGKPEQYY